MFPRMILHVLLACIATVASFPAVYDQRQTGKTNIRVELKDAVLIAFGDGPDSGGDYDYSYDYSDLTIKPSQQSTSTAAPSKATSTTATVAAATATATVAATPTTTTTSPKVTKSFVQSTSNSIFLDAYNNSVIFSFESPSENSSSKSPAPLIDDTPFVLHQEFGLQHNSSSTRTPGKVSSSTFRRYASTETISIKPDIRPKRHCSSGFVLDALNRCKRIVTRPARKGLPSPIRFRSEN